jgi:hypothetical protein
MPVFTQVCSTESVAEGTLMLATCTCSCETLPDENMMLLDTDASSSPPSLDPNASLLSDMFVHIDGVRHWRTCALFAYSSQNDKMALLKHQQKLAGALTLRKPSLLAPKRTDPFAPVRWQPSRTSHLYAGSQFRGIQKSGTSSYDVKVDIKVRIFPSFLSFLPLTCCRSIRQPQATALMY